MTLSIIANTTDDDWKNNCSGWDCSGLKIPGATVNKVFAEGQELSPDNYTIDYSDSIIYWKSNVANRPDNISVFIDVDESQVYSKEDTTKYRYLALILPIIATIVTTIITVYSPLKDTINTKSNSNNSVPAIDNSIEAINNSDFINNISENNIRNIIDKTTNELFFFGANFNVHVTREEGLIREKLSQGIDVNYLVLNPESNNIQEMAIAHGRNPGEFKRSFKSAFNDLQKLMYEYEQTSNGYGQLTIKIYDSIPRARIYFFDPKSKNGTIYLVPYVNKVRTKNLIGFLIKNSQNDSFEAYFEGVNELWKDAIDLSEWLEKNPTYKVYE